MTARTTMPVWSVIIRSLLAMIVASVAPKGFAADWADPTKVLKVAFPTDVSGLDPAGTQETYATVVEARIFDALYVWDYLARPYRFVPSIATDMPEISADGRIWTIHIRWGIYFAHDPAFGGKKRELTAADFVYAWKRSVDPRVRSPNSDLLEAKIVGLDAAGAHARGAPRGNREIRRCERPRDEPSGRHRPLSPEGVAGGPSHRSRSQSR